MVYQTTNKKRLKWLYNHAGIFRKDILLSFVLHILAVTLSLFFVENTKIFMEGIEKGENFPIYMLVAILATIKSLHIFCLEFQLYLKQRTNSLLSNALSLHFFKEILASSTYYKEKIHSGDALNRLTTDVSDVSNCLTETIPGLIYSFVQLVATCIYLTLIEPVLTIVIFLIMPIAITIGHIYAKKLLPVAREIRFHDSKVNQFMQEHLAHHELIVTLDKTAFIWKRLQSLQNVLYQKLITRIRLSTMTNSLTDIAFELSYIIIFIWGIYGIQNNTFSYAQLVVFLQLAEQIQVPFLEFKLHYPMLVASIASIERLVEIENLPKEDNSNAIIFSKPVGIEFRQVDFRYMRESPWLYRDFNHNFPPGSITAIVGETGAGKSTMLRLILALLSPNAGSVSFYIDDNGIKKYAVSSQIRGNCVYVPQGNSLISGTIRYNLLLGKTSATEDEMKEVLYLAAADFVMKDFPYGLDTLVGEGGIGISEGQAQRIAIARSFLRPGKVILMDEPTSALDEKTEKLFLMRLTNQTYNKTIIIVTHKKEICKYVSEVITIERVSAQY